MAWVRIMVDSSEVYNLHSVPHTLTAQIVGHIREITAKGHEDVWVLDERVLGRHTAPGITIVKAELSKYSHLAGYTLDISYTKGGEFNRTYISVISCSPTCEPNLVVTEEEDS